MNILQGITNFLNFINEHWTSIAVMVGLIILIAKKIKDFMSKSDDEKIQFALSAIRETMLKYVTQAEKDYSDWSKSGSIKRAQVIEQLYKEYPVLSKVVNQEELINQLDDAIDSALPTLRKIIEENK